MKKLSIINEVYYHYEIIESVLLKYYTILNIEQTTPVQIYLYIKSNKSFEDYIKQKYPDIKLVTKPLVEFDYLINCTVYDRDANTLDKTPNSNKKYIAHEITKNLLTNPNVFYLTPLSKKNVFHADILPFSDKKTTTQKPIYIIQGNLNHNRRHLPLLIKILDNSYKYDFIIKLVGKGYLPSELNKYKNKITLKNNLNFQDFHNEFTNAYCILPLITKQTKPQYYTKKLTSTINYAKGYNLKCLIDKDLQKIYNLNNVEVFNNENDIVTAFKKTLENFYNNT